MKNNNTREYHHPLPRTFITSHSCRIIHIGLVLLLVAVATAHSSLSGDFNYVKINNEVTITGYTGENVHIVIPDEIEGLTVVAIADFAFAYNTSLASVAIPSSVTSIGNWVFSGCSSLMSITVAVENAYYNSVDGVLFDKDTLTLLQYPEAREGAHYEIPHSVNTIEDWAFAECNNLQSVKIPDSVVHIGNYAFVWCYNLQSVEIPDSVTSIGGKAFYDCVKLQNVQISQNVSHIGPAPFAFCRQMTFITVAEDNPNYSSVDGVLFDKDKLILIQYPAGKENIAYEIPDSVTTIGESAFRGCINMQDVRIPYSVTRLEQSAFSWCIALESIVIPGSITHIENHAFFGCEGLTHAIISEGVTIIGRSVFGRCSSLISVKIPDSVTEIGGGAFQYCTSLQNIEIPNTVSKIEASTFANCANLQSIVIGKGVNIIERAFQSCSSLYAVMFMGDPPLAWGDIFDDSPDVTVYYLYANKGAWNSTYAGKPTAIWPEMARAETTPDGFAFDIIASKGQEVVVEMSTDLTTGVWTPIATHHVPAGNILEFSDPDWDTDASRFYRIVLP